MWKFPEPSDRKLELRMPKNGPKDMRKNLILFQQSIGKTYFLLMLVGKLCVRLAVRWFTLPPVAAVSINGNQYWNHQRNLSPATKNTE